MPRTVQIHRKIGISQCFYHMCLKSNLLYRTFHRIPHTVRPDTHPSRIPSFGRSFRNRCLDTAYRTDHRKIHQHIAPDSFRRFGHSIHFDSLGCTDLHRCRRKSPVYNRWSRSQYLGYTLRRSPYYSSLNRNHRRSQWGSRKYNVHLLVRTCYRNSSLDIVCRTVLRKIQLCMNQRRCPVFCHRGKLHMASRTEDQKTH